MNDNGGLDPHIVNLLTAPEIAGERSRYALQLRLFLRTGLDVVAGIETDCPVAKMSEIASSFYLNCSFLITALVVLLLNKQA
jgi:hypothetical protein